MFPFANPGSLTSGSQRERMETVGTRRRRGRTRTPPCSVPLGPVSVLWPRSTSVAASSEHPFLWKPYYLRSRILDENKHQLSFPPSPPAPREPDACLAECIPTGGSVWGRSLVDSRRPHWTLHGDRCLLTFPSQVKYLRATTLFAQMPSSDNISNLSHHS